MSVDIHTPFVAMLNSFRSLQQQKLDSTPSQVEFKSKDESKSNSISGKGGNFKEVENPVYDMEYLDGTPSQDEFKSKDGSNRVSSKGRKDVIDKNPAYYEVPVTMNDMEETDIIYDVVD